MKKSISLLIILLLLSCSSLYAQFSAGRVYIGGNTSMSLVKDFSKSQSTAFIDLKGGLMVKEYTLVGGKIGYVSTGTEVGKQRDVLLGGFWRQYWTKDFIPEGFFTDTSIEYLVSSTIPEGGGATDSESSIYYGLGIGYDWFVVKNVAIEPMIDYRGGFRGGTSQLGFRLGLLLVL